MADQYSSFTLYFLCIKKYLNTFLHKIHVHIIYKRCRCERDYFEQAINYFCQKIKYFSPQKTF